MKQMHELVPTAGAVSRWCYKAVPSLLQVGHEIIPAIPKAGRERRLVSAREGPAREPLEIVPTILLPKPNTGEPTAFSILTIRVPFLVLPRPNPKIGLAIMPGSFPIMKPDQELLSKRRRLWPGRRRFSGPPSVYSRANPLPAMTNKLRFQLALGFGAFHNTPTLWACCSCYPHFIGGARSFQILRN